MSGPMILLTTILASFSAFSLQHTPAQLPIPIRSPHLPGPIFSASSSTSMLLYRMITFSSHLRVSLPFPECPSQFKNLFFLPVSSEPSGFSLSALTGPGQRSLLTS